ncbi:diguanylate cyclase [Xanthomonas sp. AmX2]|uniref:diguanylate cyclase domain-containing protein n=1 Tax=Xanthomonas sp. TaxID=29446 RepID=UPI00197DE48C|nr:diguanylate cyclase [Xanthomonas sp.]MBN6151025.1 diguanylate cyclase [Xanthomonas sp.]
MTTQPLPEQSAADTAKLELFEFRRQALIARLELDGLQQDVANLRTRFPPGPISELQAANEQLLLSTLRTQARLDDYEHALAEAARNATRDPLTQLPNRSLLFEHLDRAIAGAASQRSRIAVLFVDLNEFKQINDLLGHATGDEFLRLAAERITAAAGTNAFVARYGGDEFVVVLDESSDDGAACMVGRLVAGLEAPCVAGGHALQLGASIGISLYPDDADTGMALLQRADDAMYCVKRQTSASFRFYGQCSAEELHARRPARASPAAAPATPADDPHDALRQANSQLVLAALNAQELQAAAEQAFQRQNEMLAFVAHELRNPLTPIRIAGAMLDTLPGTELLRMQQIIEHEVVHMNRLIGDLLDVSRVRTGKLRVLKERVDLHDIVEAAATACRPAMDARRQRFELQLQARPMMIHGDAIRLSQVLRNLLDNASKYTPEGGWIGLALRADGDGDGASIVVSDSGIGISADALQRIFEPFVQDPHAVGFNGAGLGIGLTVVREILAAHGGSVAAYSAGIGLGCEFSISLPLYQRPGTGAG